MKTYGVIMAGGGGTRFWPLSRKKTPKQLLNLTGNDVMVNEAILRLSSVVEKEDVFIVTNEEQVASMEEVTKNIVDSKKILAEPSARNTAACIGYAAMEIVKKYGDGVMIITPSDAYIKNTDEFSNILKIATKEVEENNTLVTIGIEPTFPATGYGYIKYNKEFVNDVKPVVEFKEKPDFETAKKYVESNEYAWNSGMFVWKASTILEKFEKYIPDIYEDLNKIGDAMGTSEEKTVLKNVYSEIRKISVDYAIMEPSAANGDVVVVPGEFGWNDVGSWDMMDVLHEKDCNGNVCIGDTLMVNSSNSVVYSTNKKIATVGIDGLVIVETDDVIMVCPKDKAQDVKLIVDELTDKGMKDFL